MGASDSSLRIIDANMNRAAEGMRVMEDIARLSLNSPTISAELKTIRHALVETTRELQTHLIRSRDADSDVGKDTEVSSQSEARDLYSVLVANSRRVQESLRVLEEMAKIPIRGVALKTESFRQTRFRLYTIEKNMLSLLTDSA